MIKCAESNHPKARSIDIRKVSKAAMENYSKSMDIIYPKEMSKIYVPIDLDGKLGKTVFKVAHRSANATIYWHLDDEYLGATIGIHQMSLSPEPGTHVLTLVDQTGETLTRNFVIEQKEKTK